MIKNIQVLKVENRGTKQRILVEFDAEGGAVKNWQEYLTSVLTEKTKSTAQASQPAGTTALPQPFPGTTTQPIAAPPAPEKKVTG